jgi:hypothetical protein
MRPLADCVAVFSCGLFAGAAIYISLVEHPARMECGIETAAAEFSPSYRWATVRLDFGGSRTDLLHCSAACRSGVLVAGCWKFIISIACIHYYGHIAGDFLLVTISERCLISVRHALVPELRLRALSRHEDFSGTHKRVKEGIVATTIDDIPSFSVAAVPSNGA